MSKRTLFIVADDFGIGPGTSAGILELAHKRRVSAALLLVNSPYAPAAVQAWRQAGRPLLLGWHPCLTLDRPVLPAQEVPSLVDAKGHFLTLRQLLYRWATGMLSPFELLAELRSQYARFIELTGEPPAFMAGHHHIQVFPPIGEMLLDILQAQGPPFPYIRRISEPWQQLLRVQGVRLKRCVLHWLGQRLARLCSQRGFPGNDNFIGLANPNKSNHPSYFTRWLHQLNGHCIELMCHPGHPDPTLAGRDIPRHKALDINRVREWQWLQQSDISQRCEQEGIHFIAPEQLGNPSDRSWLYAA